MRGTPAERVKRRVDKLANHMESWLGDLTREQRALIERRLAESDDFVEERLADRRYRQQETLALIRAKPPKDAMVAGLRRLLIDTESWRKAEYTRHMRERDRRMFALLAELSGTLSPEQRKHLQGRIRAYLADISRLTNG